MPCSHVTRFWHLVPQQPVQAATYLSPLQLQEHCFHGTDFSTTLGSCIVLPYRGKLRRGKFSSGKIFVGENYSSPGKYFVTFSPRKFSPVVFESNHFLTFFNASNIINQSVITTDTFLVLLVIESSNVSFFIFLINLTFIIHI